MTNLGVVPVDPATPIGQVRHLLGDTEYETWETPDVGDYTNFSDEEIGVFLMQGGGSPLRAAGYGYLKWYAFLSAQSAAIATDDLKVDLTKRAGAYLELARLYLGEADVALTGGGNDFFAIVPLGGYPSYTRPEGAPYAAWEIM